MGEESELAAHPSRAKCIRTEVQHSRLLLLPLLLLGPLVRHSRRLELLLVVVVAAQDKVGRIVVLVPLGRPLGCLRSKLGRPRLGRSRRQERRDGELLELQQLNDEASTRCVIQLLTRVAVSGGWRTVALLRGFTAPLLPLGIPFGELWQGGKRERGSNSAAFGPRQVDRSILYENQVARLSIASTREGTPDLCPENATTHCQPAA